MAKPKPVCVFTAILFLAVSSLSAEEPPGIDDTDAHLVRRLDFGSGRVSTLAGSGEGGFGGDGGPALAAQLARPHVAVRARNSDLIVGDSFNQRIRLVSHETGLIQTIAGKGEKGAADDGTPALEAPFAYFGDMVELPNGDLLFTEWVNGRVVRLDRGEGRLRLVAGTTEPSASERDGLDPLATRFGPLAGLAPRRLGPALRRRRRGRPRPPHRPGASGRGSRRLATYHVRPGVRGEPGWEMPYRDWTEYRRSLADIGQVEGQAFRVGRREPIPQDLGEEGEDRGAGAEAERERQGDAEREQGTPGEAPEGQAEVTEYLHLFRLREVCQEPNGILCHACRRNFDKSEARGPAPTPASHRPSAF